MSAFASTSRLVTSRLCHSSQRRFTTSAVAHEKHITLTFAGRRSTFLLPSVSSLIEPFFAPRREQQLVLAGIDTAEEDSIESDSVLEWDGVLNAVPKSKVSHSRKAMRAANKGLKDRVDLVHCQGCGKPKLAHHICSSCYSIINRAQKATRKEQMQGRSGEGSETGQDNVATSL